MNYDSCSLISQVLSLFQNDGYIAELNRFAEDFVIDFVLLNMVLSFYWSEILLKSGEVRQSCPHLVTGRKRPVEISRSLRWSCTSDAVVVL